MEESYIAITDPIKADLEETARWGKFMSIVGFISVGFLLLIAFSLLLVGNLGQELNGFSQAFIAGFYFVVAIIYVFPVVFLYRYSREMKRALIGEDRVELESAFGNLKKLFVFFGVVTALTLIIYALAIISVAAGGIIGNMM